MEQKRWIECWSHYCILGHFGKYKILFNPTFVKHYFYKRGEIETMDGCHYEMVNKHGKR